MPINKSSKNSYHFFDNYLNFFTRWKRTHREKRIATVNQLWYNNKKEVNPMNKPTFEWDENKNTINKKKHKVSFEEAKTVFFDYDALYMPDPEHSETEERFIILGMSSRANLLIVCHCYRQSESVIRIISARKADKGEQQMYFEG